MKLAPNFVSVNFFLLLFILIIHTITSGIGQSKLMSYPPVACNWYGVVKIANDVYCTTLPRARGHKMSEDSPDSGLSSANIRKIRINDDVMGLANGS